MLRNFGARPRTARLAIGVWTTIRTLAPALAPPEREIPTYEQFFEQCQQARYKNGGNRGCC